MPDAQNAIKEFIQTELAVGLTRDIAPDEDLFTSGILDSLAILQLVMFIEEQFGVEVPDGDVVFENFHSVAAIQEYINGRGAQSQ